MEILKELFGEGRDLSPLQMGCRAFVVFFITLILIRIAGMRTFGKKSAFDSSIVIMLGAILSRAVTGVSPFVPTITASLVLVLIHRFLGWLSLYNEPLNRFIKGEERILFKDGHVNRENMKHGFLTDSDLMEGVRLQANTKTLDKVEEIYMEPSGQISVIKKEGE